MIYKYLPGDAPDIDLSKPQLLTSNRMQVSVMYTGQHCILCEEVRITAIVVAGNNSAFKIGHLLKNFPLSDYKVFNHKITLKNDMKATVKGEEIKEVDYSKPQLMVNDSRGTIIITTGSIDSEQGTMEGIIVYTKDQHEVIGQYGDWYMNMFRVFTGELTLKND